MKTVTSYQIARLMGDMEAAARALAVMPSGPLRDLAYSYVDKAIARAHAAFLTDVAVEPAREVEAV